MLSTAPAASFCHPRRGWLGTVILHLDLFSEFVPGWRIQPCFRHLALTCQNRSHEKKRLLSGECSHNPPTDVRVTLLQHRHLSNCSNELRTSLWTCSATQDLPSKGGGKPTACSEMPRTLLVRLHILLGGIRWSESWRRSAQDEVLINGNTVTQEQPCGLQAGSDG